MPYRCMTRYAELTHGARCLPFQEWRRAPSQFSRWCSIKKTEPCSMCFWKPEFQNRRRRQVLRRGPRSAAEAANPDAFLECSDQSAPEGTANDLLHSNANALSSLRTRDTHRWGRPRRAKPKERSPLIGFQTPGERTRQQPPDTSAWHLVRRRHPCDRHQNRPTQRFMHCLPARWSLKENPLFRPASWFG